MSDILILTAMEDEYNTFSENYDAVTDSSLNYKVFFLNQSTKVIIKKLGIGKLNAALDLVKFLNIISKQSFNIQHIINIGLCGSRNINHNIGDVFSIEKIRQHDLKIPFDIYLPIIEEEFTANTLDIFPRNNIISGDQFIEHENELYNNFEFDLIDMESFSIIKTIHTLGYNTINYFIKIISDIIDGSNKDKFIKNAEIALNNNKDILFRILNNLER